MGRQLWILIFSLLLPLPSVQGEEPAGILVESVDERSATAKAGLRPGDRLLSWERPPAPPGSPEPARGTFRTPFDLSQVILEQAPRGAVRLKVERAGEALQIDVPVGKWSLIATPILDTKMRVAYEEAIAALDAEDPAPGLAALRTLAAESSGELAAWFHARLAYHHQDQYEGGPCVTSAEAARKAGAEIRDPVSRYHLRDLYLSCLEYDDRLDEGEEMLFAAQKEHGDHPEQFLAAAHELDMLGTIEWLRYDLVATQRITEQTLAIQEHLAPRSLETSETLLNLGYVHAMVGRVGISEPYFRRSYDIVAEVGPESEHMMASIRGLSYLAGKRGNPEQQVEQLEKAVAFCEKYGCHPGNVALDYSHLSFAHEALGNLEEAERLERQALEIREGLDPDSQAVATSLGALAKIRYRQGELDGAEEMMTRALAMQIRATGERSLGVTAIHRDLGNLKRDRGEREDAKKHYEDALSILSEFAPGTIAEAGAQHRLGTMAREDGENEVALRYFLGAVQALESQTRNLGGTQEDVSGYRARYAHYYRDLIEMLLKLGRSEEAFGILERSRSRVLLAMLADRELFFRDPPTQALAVEKAEADMAYGDALRDLARLSANANAGDEARDAILARLEELRRQQARVQSRIRTEAPRLSEIQDPQPLDLAAVRKALPEGTLLLSYLLGPEGGHVFVLGPGDLGLEVHDIPLTEKDAAARVENLRRLLQQERGRRGRAALRREVRALGTLLLGPVAERLEAAERLLILPDGPLYLLPFAALGDPTAEDGFRFLMEAHPIHLASSATVLARARGSGSRNGVIAFGNPAYPAAEADTPAVETITRAGMKLTPLPATEQEVRSLEAIFQDSKIYLGGDATEDRAKSLPARVAVVHFAAHGWVDDRFPLESAIALTIPEAPAPGEDNGLLQAWEVFEGVRIDADLVTLSACNTALGRNLAGEGIIGLSRAFQFAGARSVLASLWSVNDVSTAALMERFYRAVAEGDPRDEALRRAQLSLLREPVERPGAPPLDAAAPFYWAGFQLLGDPR